VDDLFLARRIKAEAAAWLAINPEAS
jgi:hypothetical protein